MSEPEFVTLPVKNRTDPCPLPPNHPPHLEGLSRRSGRGDYFIWRCPGGRGSGEFFIRSTDA